jgi:hypothetical protein
MPTQDYESLIGPFRKYDFRDRYGHPLINCVDFYKLVDMALGQVKIKQGGDRMFTLKEGMHRFTEVQVLDEPGAGGAYHEYRVKDVDGSAVFAAISFQKGPVQESGKNGIFIEDLLNICAHRLECFQAGDFACGENEKALSAIKDALKWLNKRTADRQARGVEGRTEK